MQLTNESISIQIVSYKQEKVTTFTIEIKTRLKQQWWVEKRYSQFEDLNSNLEKLFDRLPALPKKSFVTFLVGKSKEDLEDRRKGLEEYLRQLVVRREIFNSQILRQFLQFDKVDDVNAPSLAFEHVVMHGIRDVIIAGELLFILNSDMSILNRVDAYVANMKMPWESERGEPTNQAVGRLECYLMSDQSFEKKWNKEYNSQAICMYYDSDTLLIGLDSGTVNLLTIANSIIKESLEIEMHLDRVMGVYYRKKLVHSVSKDRHYRIVDMDKVALAVDLELSAFELTALHVNYDRKISIIGDRGGQLFILNIEEIKPTLILTLSLATPFIRDILIDDIKNYLITLAYDEGGITVMDLAKPGQEMHAKITTKIPTKVKSRQLQWSPSRGELFIGNDDGTITIYSAVQLQPIYVLKGHDSAVTKLIWFEDQAMLLSGGKDRKLRWWQFPKEWRQKEALQKETQHIQQQTKIESMLKLQKTIDSDEEDSDIGKWHK